MSAIAAASAPETRRITDLFGGGLNARSGATRGGLLFGQLCLEGSRPFGDVGGVTSRIDERGDAGILLLPGILRFEIEVAAVRAQEQITMKRRQYAECSFVIGGDLRIQSVPYELVSGVHVRTADDYGVVRLAGI